LQRSSFFARAWLKVDVEHRTLGCKSYLPFSRIHVKWDRPQGHRKSEDKGKERERERERENAVMLGMAGEAPEGGGPGGAGVRVWRERQSFLVGR
jgi:hypothetical protein